MFVAIVRIPAPPVAEAAAGMERRFAASLPHVEQAPGFAGFELLRPVAGSDHYLSISRWRTRADFEAWAQSASNARAHGRPPASEGAPAAPAPAPTGGLPPGVELYEVSEL